MENLKHGWKKCIRKYHYHAINDLLSICGRARYYMSRSKELEFLADFKITPDMRICPECYTLRKDRVRHEIVRQHQESVTGYRKIYELKERTCNEPGCKARGIALVCVSNEEEKPHYCIRHNVRVQNRIGKKRTNE